MPHPIPLRCPWDSATGSADRVASSQRKILAPLEAARPVVGLVGLAPADREAASADPGEVEDSAVAADLAAAASVVPAVADVEVRAATAAHDSSGIDARQIKSTACCP
jgi:hypothetical protein